jgi:hypothetical protein
MTGQIPTPPPPAPPVQVPGTDIATMQAQLGDLVVQHEGLQAQWNGLKSQLDQMLRNNPARPGVQQQWADVGSQKAKVEGDIAQLRARIAQREGLPVGTPVIPVPPPRLGPNLDIVIPAITAMTVILAFPVALAWARRILRGAPKADPVSHDQAMRLERMEQAIDTIAIEVERISEGQRFVTRVMTDRPSAAAAADASSGEKQPLALGAGPMEPIVVSDRERVRQRVITPH